MMRGPVALALAVVLGGVGLSSPEARAQEQKRQFVPKAQGGPAPGEAPARRREQKGPGLDGERYMRAKVEVQAEAKWQESFKLLKKLIESTGDNDPTKPDLFYRLSEMYWERASSAGMVAFAREEQCLERARGNAGTEAECTRTREAEVAATEGYRDQAIKVYKHIVQNYPRYPRLDGVLFALAFNYQQKGEPEGAKKIYIELIKRYPDSDHIADSLLNLGEILFDAG
jgi:tetratricopeptide (TPR) repeat protein